MCLKTTLTSPHEREAKPRSLICSFAVTDSDHTGLVQKTAQTGVFQTRVVMAQSDMGVKKTFISFICDYPSSFTMFGKNLRSLLSALCSHSVPLPCLFSSMLSSPN